MALSMGFRACLLRLACLLLGLLVLGLLAWAFLAYTRPGLVLNFATLLQMCGLR